MPPSGNESPPSNSSPGVVVPTVPLESPAPTPPPGNPSTPQSWVPLPVPAAVPPSGNASPTPSTSRLPGSTFSSRSTTFSLPEPANLSRSRRSSLWATYYYTHQAGNTANGRPLLDVSGKRLGVTLSQRDWCAAALEGSVQIVNGSQILGTYNYAGRGRTEQVDCAAYYPRLKTISATNRVRFKRSNALYGEGVQGYELVPYRTIAVDPTLIPIGSVVYIPAARGTTVVLPSGDRAIHDGYFYAADVGKAIQGNHIDVFLGITNRNPFPFVQSRPSASFQAYIITDPTIKATLTSQHRLNRTTASVSR